MISENIWKDIPGSNGSHQMNCVGLLRSWVSKGKKLRTKEPVILNTPINGNGYPHFSIRIDGKQKFFRVHRMVGILFVPNPHNYPAVLHKDDVKTNCHYLNLEWGTSLKNNRDAFTRGIIIPAKGVARKKSSLTEKDVKNIFKLKSKKTARVLAKIYKVNHTCIVDIWSGRSWNHITGLPCTRKIKPKFSKDIKFKD